MNAKLNKNTYNKLIQALCVNQVETVIFTIRIFFCYTFQEVELPSLEKKVTVIAYNLPDDDLDPTIMVQDDQSYASYSVGRDLLANYLTCNSDEIEPHLAIKMPFEIQITVDRARITAMADL